MALHFRYITPISAKGITKHWYLMSWERQSWDVCVSCMVRLNHRPSRGIFKIHFQNIYHMILWWAAPQEIWFCFHKLPPEVTSLLWCNLMSVPSVSRVWAWRCSRQHVCVYLNPTAALTAPWFAAETGKALFNTVHWNRWAHKHTSKSIWRVSWADTDMHLYV